MQRAHVSKEHCVIRVVDNEVVLKNLSENCTAVNAHILEAGQQRTLASGDVITIVGRSLRYEESRSVGGPATPAVAASSLGAAVPQTDVPRHRQQPPPVFASGGKQQQQPQHPPRQLRRRLSRTPQANPDTARKLRLWDAHYSAGGNGAMSSALELPTLGLPDTSQNSLQDSTAMEEDEDPFAIDSTAVETPRAFQRMAASVHGNGSIKDEDRIGVEVARIMGEISHMARNKHGVASTTATLVRSIGRKRPRAASSAAGEDSGEEWPLSDGALMQRQRLQRSRSLDPPQSPTGQQCKQKQLAAVPAFSAYGSEDETSRTTVGISPQSTYSRSPTLQWHRHHQQIGNQPEDQAVLRLPPATADRVAMRNRSLDASPGVGGLSSPLKRTLSSSQPRPVATRLPPLPPSFVSALAVGGPADETQEEEEVPTEPEPETESDRETDSVPALGPTTPEPRRGQRPRLMQEASAARKSVRFGPALSPEVFDAQAPPATPLRRGTPIQMARASSILRRTSPTRATMASPSLLRSLLTPRPTRRQAMHSYLATLAKQDPSPPPTERCAVVADTDQLKNVGVLSSAQAIDPDQIMVAKPEITAVDIESPTALGASPADRRRRRSVRLNARRVSLDSPSRVAGGGGGSPSRLVSCSVARRPPAAAALASQRHHRRRTAPAGGIAAESLALLAAALGEDVPRLAAAPKAAEAVEEKETEEPSEWETDGADGVPDLGCGLPASPALGLADAMQGAEREADQPITSEPLFESSLSLSSSDLVLREQAERQARISGADDCEWAAARLAGLSVASPADPQQPEGSSARQQQRRRRQTIDGLVAPLSTSLLEGAEDGADGALALASADDILAHRQRLRRLQERRHRRQTLAALNKRRSSWRGWMPRAVMTMSSPPSSPEPADHVAHCATPPSLPALHGSRSPHVTGHSHAAMQHALSALLPAAIAAGGGQEGNPVSSAYSAPSSSFISADSMYPPAAWNNGEPSTAGGSSARRRITDIVVSALGMGHAKEPMAAEPAVSASSPAFAYPPRPVPIDAEWETIEHADQTVATPPLQQDAESRKDAVFASENDEAMSQQVELFAVSQPEQFDGVGAFAEMPPAPNSSGVASLDAASKEATRPPSPTIASPAAVASPDASVSTPDPSVVFSPPTTRGRTRCQNLPPATKPAPSAATVDTKPSVGRRRAPLAAPAAPEVPAAAVPRTTRKRRADGPPPTIVPAPATKRGRGRPPATSVVRGGQRAAEPSSVKPPVSVISPPATRSAKRAKSHAA